MSRRAEAPDRGSTYRDLKPRCGRANGEEAPPPRHAPSLVHRCVTTARSPPTSPYLETYWA